TTRLSAVPPRTAPPTQPQQPHDGTSWPAFHVTAVSRWTTPLTPNAKSASWGNPWISASPAKQFGPDKTARKSSVVILAADYSFRGQRGHPNMGGPMRMNPPRGMAMGPQNYGGMRPPPNSMGGPMPGMNMGPGGRGPWPGPNANSIAYSSSSPGNYVGPPGGGGPPGTPIMPSPGDSTNSSENIYTMMNPIGPGGNRPNFPMGPGPDGPMGAMGAMEPHHMNGSLGSGDMDGLPKVRKKIRFSLNFYFFLLACRMFL
ncbi:hypothetical protein INR49_014330, partial [Caranx melampygus]